MSDPKDLDAIADVIQGWLDWQGEDRGKVFLSTDQSTHMMSLPVAHWPSRGQLELWVKTLREHAKK